MMDCMICVCFCNSDKTSSHIATFNIENSPFSFACYNTMPVCNCSAQYSFLLSRLSAKTLATSATILIFLIIYIFSILLYESTRKNYRRREENGSAKWGEAKELNKKYKQPNNYNKLLTKNVSVGLNGRKHRRNVNVLVIGGSGAGKTFSYCKPNVMQCATSYVILDPKGEIVRDTGYLLEKERI